MNRLRTGALAALVLLAPLPALAACSLPGTTTRPTVAVTGTPAPAPPSIDVEQPGQTPSAGQVDSDWGPIWATLPDGFPTPPGAQEAEAETAVSAAYAVPTTSMANARQVASFYAQAFSSAGYGGSIDGPLEDGSYGAWASNGYGCDVRVEAVPRGSEETYVTVFYGAMCPFSWAG
jgi:hypothetical protein